MEGPQVLLRTPVAADLSMLASLADQVDAMVAGAGLPPELAYRLNLALEEIITNIIMHGSVDGKEPVAIEVTVTRSANQLQVEIADSGRAFDPQSAPVPDTGTAMQDRPIGGLGIHLVRSLMDGVAYQRDGERNRLTLTKTLPI